MSGLQDQSESGAVSESILPNGDEIDAAPRGRPRAARANGVGTNAGHKYGSSDESDGESGETSSGHEWDGGDDNDADDESADDEDEDDLEMSDGGASDGDVGHNPKSLVVRLRYGKTPSASPPSRQEQPNGVSTGQANAGPSPLGKSPPLTSDDIEEQSQDAEMADAIPEAALQNKDDPAAKIEPSESHRQAQMGEQPSFASSVESHIPHAHPAQPVA